MYFKRENRTKRTTRTEQPESIICFSKMLSLRVFLAEDFFAIKYSKDYHTNIQKIVKQKKTLHPERL